MGSRILVVEDEENIRNMVRRTLEADGHTVSAATSGKEGLRYFGGDGSGFNIALLDQRLGDALGIDVQREMQTRNPNVWTIMMTAVGTVGLEDEARQAGADDFIRKPFTTDLLRVAVERAVYGRRPPHRWQNIEETTLSNGFAIALSLEEPHNGNAAWHGFITRLLGRQQTQAFRETLLVTSPAGETRECVVTVSPAAIERVNERLTAENIQQKRLLAASCFHGNSGLSPDKRGFPADANAFFAAGAGKRVATVVGLKQRKEE